ncbi:MAG: hypothetical protein PWP28_240 [Oceanotoga sp.]|nr:hypothetical protein [Oceanotoga sp.]
MILERFIGKFIILMDNLDPLQAESDKVLDSSAGSE